jgi:endoglucanase
MNINLNTKTISRFALTFLIFALILNTSTVNSEYFTKFIYTQNELQSITINSWNKYKLRFIKNDERVIDQDDNSTTSEGQSYSMLRSIMMNDKNVFDRTYLWTKKYMQIRKSDNLFAWKTNVDIHGNSYNTQVMNATDADLDIGLALALADKKWSSYGTINYATELKMLITDIYDFRVVDINGLKVLLPFNSQKWRGLEIINPSYFNPVAYRLFSNYDYNHNWNKLAEDSYHFMNWLHVQNGLFPDWVEYNYNTYRIENYPRNIRYGEDNFGYEAFRIYFRMNLDYNLYGSPSAKRFLDNARWFMEHEFTNQKKICAVYNKYGDSIENYEQMTTTSSTYFIFKNTNSNYFEKFVNDKIYSKINRNIMQFNENDNYYSSTWGWFALADKAGIKLVD